MSYLVLARRWRPKRFADLVGQDVAVRTLKNALSSGNLAHAYLLTGIRGVGKTTIARLMAMAVNCISLKDGEPCGECEVCGAIARGSNLDVQEMDAASHTGVDDIREILDGVRYPPASLKYKVYIIDEAHMLSKSAFNALLKTLEEPPERVLFILATTEVEKLPITVRSRCQRFDLRRLGANEIVDYLAHVLGQEKIQADESALQLIARAADGSVRDALSLTERVLAYASNGVTAEDVQQALGLIGPELVRNLAACLFEGDATRALNALKEAACGGHVPRTVLLSLSELLHQLVCVQVEPKLLGDEPDDGQRQWLSEWSGRWDVQELDLRYQVLLHGLRDLALVDEQRGAEMILIRLCHLHMLSSPKTAADAAPMPRPKAEAVQQSEPVKAQPAFARSDEMTDSRVDAQAEEVEDEPCPADDGEEESLPLHEQGAPVFRDWSAAVAAYGEIRPGVSAMLEHVVCVEFASRVRLALDKHQQRAIAAPERSAFAEWLGRDVFWEARQEQEGESLSELRQRQAETEKRHLWEHAESDPHLQTLMQSTGARLVDVRPAGVEEK